MTDRSITAWLIAASSGTPPAIDELVPLVYDELRRMARRFMVLESPPRAFDTTELVHEAYLKLAGGQNLPALGRRYFFGAAARAMRQVLVDEARRRSSLRRGGVPPLTLAGLDPAAPERGDDVLAVDEAVARLATQYPRQAQVVECRFFAGLSVEETAQAMELSPRTVKRDWSLAQAWLFRELKRSG